MEKKREQGGILSSVAELFDLPPDVVAGLPRLELVGNRQLYLEHHTGLLAYSELFESFGNGTSLVPLDAVLTAVSVAWFANAPAGMSRASCSASVHTPPRPTRTR